MLLFAAAYFYQDPSWNGNARLALTRALVERGSLPIDAYWSQPEWYTEDTAHYEGHYYPDKAPGSSLLAAPFYLLLYQASTLLRIELGATLTKHLLTVFVEAVSFAIGGIAMYRISERSGAGPVMALIATLATAMGTMLWPYSAAFYGHVVAASLLIISFGLLYSVRGEPEKGVLLRYFAAGLALGWAFIIEYPTALIILGLLAYAVFGVRHKDGPAIARGALAGVLGALIPLSLMLLYNQVAYGTPLAFGYAHEANASLAAGIASGVMGFRLPDLAALYHITLDPKFGLLWLSPVLLLVPVGYFVGIKHRETRIESCVSLYAIGVMLIMNSGYYFWWGGSAFGPRFIIPALPFLVVPLALLPRTMKWPATLLAAISIGQMIIPLMATIQPRLSFHAPPHEFFIGTSPFRGFSILYQYLLPLIFSQRQAGTQPWMLSEALHIPYAFSIPFLVLVEGALIAVFMYFSSRPDRLSAVLAEGAPREP